MEYSVKIWQPWCGNCAILFLNNRLFWRKYLPLVYVANWINCKLIFFHILLQLPHCSEISNKTVQNCIPWSLNPKICFVMKLLCVPVSNMANKNKQSRFSPKRAIFGCSIGCEDWKWLHYLSFNRWLKILKYSILKIVFL